MSEKLVDILVVEDDDSLRLTLADNLQDEGYGYVAVATGAQAKEAVSHHEFSLIILDIMLPDVDGYTLCREFRKVGVTARILMLTARTLEEDLLRGFEAGADDYVAKPYRLRELLARIRALLRRESPAATGHLSFSEFTLDLEARRLSQTDGSLIPLTRTEFDLLALLLRKKGKALRRQEILSEVWGQDLVVDPRTVDNFISSLKKKLGWTRKSEWTIETVRGVGYRLELA